MSLHLGKIFRRMKRLTKAQKKILYIASIALSFLFIFWSFVYGPQSRKFSAIKKELNNTEAQIIDILKIAKGKELASDIVELRASLVEAAAKMPAQDEAVIYSLSENAKKLNLEVKNIFPSGRHLLEANISGFDIEEMPISIALSGEYRLIGEYVKRLRDNFPVLISVRGLEIKGKGEAQTYLEATLRLSAYLSKERK